MTRNNLPRAVLWTMGSLLSFSAVAVAVRSLAETLSLFELLGLRNAGGLVLLVGAAALRPDLRARFRPGDLRLQLFRNLIHYTGQFAWSYGVTVLPLATAFALEFTTPLWLVLLAAPILGERLTGSRVGAVLCGLLGILVIVRPSAGSLDPSAFVMLGAAVAFAGAGIATKALTGVASTFAILFWMNLIQLLPNLAGSDPAFWTRLGPTQWAAAAALVVAGLTSHLCQTQAYRHADASVVISLDFLRLPLIALVGALVYGETLSLWVLAGAALIMGGIFWNLLVERRREVSGGAWATTSSRRPGPGPVS